MTNCLRLVSLALGLLLAASQLAAQPPDREDLGATLLGIRSELLIGIPEVRSEIGVATRQDRLLDALEADLRAQRRAIFLSLRLGQPGRGGADGARELGDRLSAALRTFDRRTEGLIAAVLEPEQAQRLWQLRLQRESGRALVRGIVAKELGLTEEQRGRIRDIREQQRESRLEAGGLLRLSNELSEEQDAELLAVLTAEQQAKWEALQGPPFEFPRRSAKDPIELPEED